MRTARMDTLVEGELTLQIRALNLNPEVETGLIQRGCTLRRDADFLSLTVEGEAALPAINRYLVAQGVDIYAFSPEKVSLEDLFLQVVGTENL